MILPYLGVFLLLGYSVYCIITPGFLRVPDADASLRLSAQRTALLAVTDLLGLYAFLGPLPKTSPRDSVMSLIIILITPAIIFFAFEYANPAGPALVWSEINFKFLVRSAVTVALMYLFCISLFAVTGSIRFSGCTLCLIAIVFDLANYYTYTYRGIPILASDLATAGTALNVASEYDYSLDFHRLILIVFLFVWCVFLFRIKKIRIPSIRKRIGLAVLSVGALISSVYILIYTPVMTKVIRVSLNTFQPIKSYKKNGSVLTFLRSIQLMIIEEPDGYSTEAVRQIAKPYMDDGKDDSNYQKPNVIVVMDEAFADLQEIRDFKTSEDIMPFYDSLTEDTVKGFVYVSVFGGQTANSEFEFLTGLSKAFLPASSTPYQLYIKDPLPNLTTFLKTQDYQGALAFHPFRKTGYNRQNVYPALGFEDFISSEKLDMKPSDLLRKQMSDKRDFEIIIENYEKAKKSSDAPFYLFNVTMQNHSPYDADYDNFDTPITIDEEEYNDDMARRYLNLIHYSDEALSYLIGYFQKVNDPTVIVFFGDHEPGLSNEFYGKLFGKSVSELSGKENLEMYKTPFLIWTNYDIEEQENVNISANYLSTLMLESTGMKLSPFNRFLSDMKKKIPILTVNGYYGDDGKYYSLNDKTSPYQTDLNHYSILQYNYLFDGEKRIGSFFE